MAARRELVFLILQYLEEDKYMETVHRFEKESGFFFNMKYLEEIVTNGDWEEVENYLSGFTKVEDNRHSLKIFFEIRKQRYLEALDSHDNDKAVEILQKDLKAFSSINPEIFKEITMLLTLENFRENEQLSSYGDAKTGRAIMLAELKKVIEANPIFHDKLEFPNFKKSRLRTLINQSLNWQHHLCNNPRQNPDIKTLFWDHSCGPGACATSPAINPLMGSLPKPAAPPSASLPGWMANPYSAPHQTVSSGPIGLTVPNNTSSLLKRPRTPPNNPAMDYQTADSGHVSKRSRVLGTSDEVNNRSLNVFPHTYPGHIHAHTPYSSEDLPKTVVVNLTLGSAAKSLEFHPLQHTLLLVGTNIGDITIWEVGRRERLVSRNFKIWDLSVCSMALQASLANEYTASVNRVIWSPDGSHVGMSSNYHFIFHIDRILVYICYS